MDMMNEKTIDFSRIGGWVVASLCSIIHLFPPNLGGSARILDKVHPISAVRHISQLN